MGSGSKAWLEVGKKDVVNNLNQSKWVDWWVLKKKSKKPKRKGRERVRE